MARYYLPFTTMQWNNLKLKKCPKCGGHLKKAEVFKCTLCDFAIRIGKLYDIVGKPVDLEKEATNLLNQRR